MERLARIRRFYAALERLERATGGRRVLATCEGRIGWPERGVYFFMEDGEERSDSGQGLRIVRVGTHALRLNSRTTLWQRLSQHRGRKASGGGNHRGSIFRLLVGASLLARDAETCASWGVGSNAPAAVRRGESNHERRVSALIGVMPFVWLPVNDPPGPGSLRGYIERNSIALLSNANREPVDAASPGWLGNACGRGRGLVRDSGLWNQNHVGEACDPDFLDTLDALASEAGGAS